ncbi:MAG: hypothetical protein Q8M31_23750 [Beijerinckiaceae bacterium]|nr:hypothetical protein [Beijerinckiaceae bacterium]
MSLLPIQRALVMDTDSSTRLFITESLKTFGIPHVEDYATETLSLTRFLRGGFDLAIFDLRIWSSPVAPGGPTVVVATNPSAPNDFGVILKAQRQGADTLLEKPFTKWLLLHRLEALLATPAAKRLKLVELPTSRFRLGAMREHSF